MVCVRTKGEDEREEQKKKFKKGMRMRAGGHTGRGGQQQALVKGSSPLDPLLWLILIKCL